MRRRAWLAVLGGGAVLIGVYYGLPEGLPRSIAYEGIEVAAAIACLAGVVFHRPSLKLPWVLIALGLLAFAAGDVIWDVYDLVLGESPAVTPGDAFYLAAYPALFAAVGALVRRRDPARDRGAQVDTLVITLGAWVLVWQFLIVPAYEGDTPLLPAVEQAVVLAYPVVDVLLLGFVARLAWAPGTRVPSYWLLLSGLLAMFGADIAFAWLTHGPGYETGMWLDVVWLSSYLLLASSAAHPSMAILSEPAPRMETRIGAGRLALLGTAMLVVPAMVAFLEGRGEPVDPRLIVLASAAIAGLVLLRLVWLVRDRERTREALRLSEERFRSLVQNASDAIAVFDPDTTFTFVSPAVERLLGYRPDSLVGSSYLELINPDDRSAFEDAVAEAFLNPARTIRVEIRLRHALGAWRWSEMLLSNRTTDPSVQGMVANVRDVTDQKEVELELTQAVLTDPLTGLPNRTLLVDRLGQTVARLERSASNAAVLFLDLDRFKVVNDSLGHEAGDRLLVAVADRLRAVLRPGDTVARFGGDEFVMVCQDLADPRDAATVADRVSQTLSGEPFVVGDDEVFLTASIGVVPVLEDGSTPMDLIRDADAAMYHAKERGRSRAVFFDPSMRAGTRERLEIESGLHRALEQHEFVLHYQPVVELVGGRIVGFEALLRWQHPDRGLLPPMEFIGLAEESGLIVPIGQWALEEAASQVRGWAEAHRANGNGTLDVAVNLSAIQLRHGDLVERVAEVVRGSGIPPRALMLEITESILMDDTESSIAVLRRLRELGVVLAVDDFGTGYSSLSYLKRFPVDILKVDREFVDGLGESQEDSAIVEAVISMGHILGLRVIAEGVETPRQLERLRELGCDLAQGFLFAEPRPPDRIAELLEGGGRIELPGAPEQPAPTASTPDERGSHGAARRAPRRGSAGSTRGGRKPSAAAARTTGGRARE